LAGLSPHPPIIIPEVGRGEEKDAEATIRAMEELGTVFASADHDTLIVFTPHGLVFGDAVSIRGGARLSGDFRDFGARGVSLTLENDTELVREIASEALRTSGIRTVVLDDRTRRLYAADERLDHGVLVPLYFMVKKGFSKKIVVVNIAAMPLLDLYRYGMAIARVAGRLGRRAAVLASGDLSHRLTRGAPAGYSPKGREFDEKIILHLRDFDPEAIVGMPKSSYEEAGECGLRPITMMLGALDGREVKSDVLSYEGPYGVGYGVAILRPSEVKGQSRLSELERVRRERLASIRAGESYPVRIARSAVEEYVTKGKVMPVPGDIPAELSEPAGVFVSIHKDGMLRGCIGTTGPTCRNALQEIIQNAISAATDDPRFAGVTAQELDALDYSVDILSEPEPVESESQLDPAVYGVIVERGSRRGLLLPDLPGVDSVAQQLEIAKSKAGIRPSEPARLYRFTVTRYH
jgi:AmmeMemoRadiSam system protein A